VIIYFIIKNILCFKHSINFLHLQANVILKQQMKKVALFFLFLLITLSCDRKGDKAFTQKMVYGLKGAVKNVTSYTYKVENGKIPAKNAKYYDAKTTVTFDSMGNLTTTNELSDYGDLGKSEYSCVYFGQGKEISYIETERLYTGDVTKRTYKYVWLDDYNYTIVSQEDTTSAISYTLDKNYRLIKSVFKKKGVIQSSNEIERSYNNDKIKETKTKMTLQILGGRIIYRIYVAQKYDSYGNPTIAYMYDDTDKQKLNSVTYSEYTYY